MASQKYDNNVNDITMVSSMILQQINELLLPIAIKRSDSVRSRRKVSAVSERSDTSEHLEQEVSIP